MYVCVVCVCVCVCVCGCVCGFSVQYLMTPIKVRGLSGISIGIIMGVTLTPGYVAAVALLLAVRDLDTVVFTERGGKCNNAHF